MTKTIGFIPARWGSTRFPGKPLALLQGIPMIVWTYRQACQAQNLDQVIVATDDERIASVIQAEGGRVVMTGECANGTVRCWKALKILEKEENLDKNDFVINIQGDEPLVNPAHLDCLADRLRSSGAPMCALAAQIWSEEEWRNPAVTKVVMNEKDEALYFSRAPIPSSKDGLFLESGGESGGKNGGESDEYLYYRNCGLYGFRRDFLDEFVQYTNSKLEQREDLEQLRALEMGVTIQMEKLGPDDRVAPGIDFPDQLAELNLALDKETEQMEQVGS